MKAWRTVLGLSSAVVVVLASCESKPWRTPGTAPFTLITSSRSAKPGDTADPVQAKLYIYKGLTKNKELNFAYVGKPWVFEFPGYTYSRMTDPEGGPQGRVHLSLEIHSMNSRWIEERRRFGFDSRKWPRNEIENYRRDNELYIETGPADMNFQKGSNFVKKSPFTREDWLFSTIHRPDKFSNYKYVRHGRACDIDWYRTVNLNPNDPNSRPEFVAKEIRRLGSNKIDGLEFGYYHLQAYIDDKKFNSMALYCAGNSRQCTQYLSLPKAKMFPVRLVYPIRYVCQYREIANKVDALFAQHTISYPNFEGGPK